MQSTSAPPWQTCYYPVPKRFCYHSSNLQFPSTQLHKKPTFRATNRCTKEQDHRKNPNHSQKNLSFPQDLTFSAETRKSQKSWESESSYSDYYTHSGFYSNMWWAELKAALGQRINLEGISSSVGIVAKDKQLVVPHVAVPDIRYIDWAELKRRGFKGVVFDKDNTLTAPYSLSLWPPLGSSVALCKSLFGDNIAVFSNSAGLEEYDPDGMKAKALEDAIGIKVIRHRLKKPAGTAEEIEKQFKCESSRLIMVGDRPFTDIVYGNRNGFFTILTGPLSLEKEPFVVQQVVVIPISLFQFLM